MSGEFVWKEETSEGIHSVFRYDMSFDELPYESTVRLQPFRIKTPQSELDDLKALLVAIRLPKETFENVQTKDNFGVTRKWMVEAKNAWLDDFDW